MITSLDRTILKDKSLVADLIRSFIDKGPSKNIPIELGRQVFLLSCLIGDFDSCRNIAVQLYRSGISANEIFQIASSQSRRSEKIQDPIDSVHAGELSREVSRLIGEVSRGLAEWNSDPLVEPVDAVDLTGDPRWMIHFSKLKG